MFHCSLQTGDHVVSDLCTKCAYAYASTIKGNRPRPLPPPASKRCEQRIGRFPRFRSKIKHELLLLYPHSSIGWCDTNKPTHLFVRVLWPWCDWRSQPATHTRTHTQHMITSLCKTSCTSQETTSGARSTNNLNRFARIFGRGHPLHIQGGSSTHLHACGGVYCERFHTSVCMSPE